MALKYIHDTEEEIPEQFRELYTERDGKWVLTGITGIKTDGDVATVQEALRKERDEHKKTKAKITAWGDLKPEEVIAKLDRIEELETAAKGKLNDEQINELVEKRIGAKLKPIERERDGFKDQVATLTTDNLGFKDRETRRTIHDAARTEAQKLKVIDTAAEDVLMYAERLFEVDESGKVVAKDGVGITPGISVDIWLGEMQDKRPHWWAPSSGGGAGGGGGSKGGGGAKNPWSAEHWNLTEQGTYVKTNGIDKAHKMAEAAGSKVGATRPTVKK